MLWSSERERVLCVVLIPIMHTVGWCNLDKEELMLDTTKIHKLVSILEDADFPLTPDGVLPDSSPEVLLRFFFPSSTVRCGHTDFMCMISTSIKKSGKFFVYLPDP